MNLVLLDMVCLNCVSRERMLLYFSSFLLLLSLRIELFVQVVIWVVPLIELIPVEGRVIARLLRQKSLLFL